MDLGLVVRRFEGTVLTVSSFLLLGHSLVVTFPEFGTPGIRDNRSVHRIKVLRTARHC